MSRSKLYGVVTSINPATPSLLRLSATLRLHNIELIVVGDGKSPSSMSLPHGAFYSVSEQQKLPFALSTALPENNYSRKNLAYLLAIANGATCIYETDDDNAPNETWTPRGSEIEAVTAPATKWCNVYQHFWPGESIWPRGFPLSLIRESCSPLVSKNGLIKSLSPIQQSLVDGSPDVDAIWRLTRNKHMKCDSKVSLRLQVGTYAPFNSQNTWWWREAFLFLYLPSYCSMRATDIWRSFIAERCLRELGHCVVFHSADVVQDRNPHDLMHDFKEEISVYKGTEEFVTILEQLSLASGAENCADNLLKCYGALMANGFFPEKEMLLLEAWISDITGIFNLTK